MTAAAPGSAVPHGTAVIMVRVRPERAVVPLMVVMAAGPAAPAAGTASERTGAESGAAGTAGTSGTSGPEWPGPPWPARSAPTERAERRLDGRDRVGRRIVCAATAGSAGAART